MIARILILLIALLTLPAWGIDRLVFRNKWPRWVRLLFALPHLLLLLALTFMAINESYTMTADAVKGFLLSATLCLVVPETLTALLLLIGRIGKKQKLFRRSMTVSAYLVGAFSFILMLYSFTLGYKRIQTKQFTFTHSSIPPQFKGYRIALISDLHLGTLRHHQDVVQQIVDSINAQQPDLIVFAGDLVNYHVREIEPFRNILSQLKARDGVVSVMGNHDYLTYFHWNSSAERIAAVRQLQQEERNMGWKLLLNENLIIHRGNDSIAVIGLENHGNRPNFPRRAKLQRARKNISPKCFQLLLQHDPSYWDAQILPHTDIPLMFSGHTHAMQFQIGKWSPAAWFYPQWSGLYKQGNQALLVCPGVGEVLLPFRFGAWPEIDIITLSTH